MNKLCKHFVNDLLALDVSRLYVECNDLLALLDISALDVSNNNASDIVVSFGFGFDDPFSSGPASQSALTFHATGPVQDQESTTSTTIVVTESKQDHIKAFVVVITSSSFYR
ncbi:hypothetical protein Dimus_015497 [Dionaea muscipula]